MSVRIGDVDALARAVARRRNAAAFDEATLGAVRVIIASVRRGGDAAAYPWRFWLEGEATVSAYRPGTVRPPKPAKRPDDP